jgi:hypothetical protein
MQDTLVVTGTYLGARQTQTVGQNNFKLRRFYVDITTNPEYPNTPEFQLKGDKVTLVDMLQKGQTIRVKFNIDGRKYVGQDGKEGVITNLSAYKIEVIQAQNVASPAPASPPPAAPAPQATTPTRQAQPVPAGFSNLNDQDDLPF